MTVLLIITAILGLAVAILDAIGPDTGCLSEAFFSARRTSGR